MEYLLLLYIDEKDLVDHKPESEREAFYADMGAFVKELEEAGAFVSARREGLRPAVSPALVDVRR